MIEELIRAKPSAAKGRYLRSITLTSTMGPGVKVDPSRTRDIVEEASPRQRCIAPLPIVRYRDTQTRHTQDTARTRDTVVRTAQGR